MRVSLLQRLSEELLFVEAPQPALIQSRNVLLEYVQRVVDV
jgi:hypothetical protein